MLADKQAMLADSEELRHENKELQEELAQLKTRSKQLETLVKQMSDADGEGASITMGGLAWNRQLAIVSPDGKMKFDIGHTGPG